MNGVWIGTWVGGSRAYGTAVPGSDLDLIEIWVESLRQVCTLVEAPRPEHVKLRTVVPRPGVGVEEGDLHRYPLRRFIALARKGNPSVVETLWAPLHGEATELAFILMDARKSFIGPHIIGPHRGYMKAQVERMLGVRGGHSAGTRVVGECGYDVKYGMHALRLGLQCLELVKTGEMTRAGYVQELRSVREGRVPWEDLWERLVGVDEELGRVLASSARESEKMSEMRSMSIEALCEVLHRGAWGV